MKFPKHVILDVSDNSALSITKTSPKRYDNLYKFTLPKKNKKNTTPRSILNAFKDSSTVVHPSVYLLLRLCNIYDHADFRFGTKKKNYQINNALNNMLLKKTCLKENDSIELKLQKSIGSLGKDSTQSLFSIFFLRKEMIYTKLKYSRCPQYDMVSGGLAALFAAFLGFLICEKFGLELLDSGDFYIAYMYGVFAAFSLRPLFRSMSKGVKVYNVFSPKYLFDYVFIIFNLLIKR